MKLEPLSNTLQNADVSPLRYFIADLHLDGTDSPRALRFRSFLKMLSTCVETGPVELYIVGDLFEFWYEYKKQLFELYRDDLAALEAAFKAGVKIFLFYGNRDFSYGDYVLKRFGATVMGDGVQIVLNDHRRAWLEHGDLLCTADVRYLKFRKHIRSRKVRMLFRLMPWAVAKRLIANIRAKTVADKKNKPKTVFGIDLTAARKRVDDHTCEVLICGHTHRLQTEDLGAGKRLIVLPPWCDVPGGYVDDGRLFKSFEVPSDD
ncbi:MAG: UDP-2,3-diacylglucosamine diphosphatase [Planctomycetota bacterium]